MCAWTRGRERLTHCSQSLIISPHFLPFACMCILHKHLTRISGWELAKDAHFSNHVREKRRAQAQAHLTHLLFYDLFTNEHLHFTENHRWDILMTRTCCWFPLKWRDFSWGRNASTKVRKEFEWMSWEISNSFECERNVTTSKAKFKGEKIRKILLH